MIEPTAQRPDAATVIFNLPGYPVVDTELVPFGQRRIRVESTAEAGCPSCGVISTPCTFTPARPIRDIPVAGSVEVIWPKRRFFCHEY